MSIINDALKKVQQGLASKTDVLETIPSAPVKEISEHIFATPTVNKITETDQNITPEKPPIKSKIKSVYTNICIVLITLAITIASFEYIYQQFQINIPQVQNLAKKSFYNLIHKKDLDAKNKTTDLKPLAQLTITPAATNSNAPKPIPITLNIHGIMANGDHNLVLINDQVFQEGDEIDGAKIVKIDLDSITIINNGIQQTILVKS